MFLVQTSFLNNLSEAELLINFNTFSLVKNVQNPRTNMKVIEMIKITKYGDKRFLLDSDGVQNVFVTGVSPVGGAHLDSTVHQSCTRIQLLHASDSTQNASGCRTAPGDRISTHQIVRFAFLMHSTLFVTKNCYCEQYNTAYCPEKPGVICVWCVQALLGTVDLGQVYFEPIKDNHGNAVLVLMRDVGACVPLEGVRWIPVSKFQLQRRSSSSDEATALETLLTTLHVSERRCHTAKPGLTSCFIPQV